MFGTVHVSVVGGHQDAPRREISGHFRFLGARAKLAARVVSLDPDLAQEVPLAVAMKDQPRLADGIHRQTAGESPSIRGAPAMLKYALSTSTADRPMNWLLER